MSEIFLQVKALADQLTASGPGVWLEVEEFPSGAVSLNVRLRGRAWVMDYSPRRGFCVDELGPGEGFTTDYRYVVDDFDEAAQILLRLMRGEHDL
jgi:hypothetical protein